MTNYPSKKAVTVCDKCLTETCYKGQFPCAERTTGEAGTITDTEEHIGRMEPSAVESNLVFDVEEPFNHGIESIGPFEVHKIVVDGYRVPNLNGKLVDGMWHFTLDNRFGCDVPEKYGHGVAWVIANAMAIGAGYSCFRENSAPVNIFKCRLLGLESAGIDSVEVQGTAS